MRAPHSLALLAVVTIVVLGASLPNPARAQGACNPSSNVPLEVNLSGTGITDAQFLAPGHAPIALDCQASGATIDCAYEHPHSQEPGYASLAALLADWNAGDWAVTLNGGQYATEPLSFAPVAPDGTATVTAPAPGSTGVSSTPTVTYTHDCTNCNVILVEVSDVPNLAVDLEQFLMGAPLASPNSVTYDQLDSTSGPKPAALPNGLYEVFVTTGKGSIETRQLDQGGSPVDSFELATAALRETRETFTVPEPTTGAAAALAALWLLRALDTRVRPAA